MAEAGGRTKRSEALQRRRTAGGEAQAKPSAGNNHEAQCKLSTTSPGTAKHTHTHRRRSGNTKNTRGGAACAMSRNSTRTPPDWQGSIELGSSKTEPSHQGSA
ncbi:unnamed protein product [Pleuronectes platessa]|uniref:Uncharacterized protein n=1 Tax=Pleuronectes platessa TaxID=8262 RepID=A0A9N7YWS2_PLEPL|nr:unnamed protein product [Pleuronectes platessa]